MNPVTLEVELDHGRIRSKGPQPLPDKGSGLLTLFPPAAEMRDPFEGDPELQRVKFFEDPSKPLEPGDWPGAFC